jgi:hypothetical protein
MFLNKGVDVSCLSSRYATKDERETRWDLNADGGDTQQRSAREKEEWPEAANALWIVDGKYTDRLVSLLR